MSRATLLGPAEIRDLAVNEFIGDGGQLTDLSLVLRSDDATDAAKARYLAGVELERVLVDIGDRVKEGQIVATIDRGRLTDGAEEALEELIT